MERLFIYPELYHDFNFLPQFVLRKGVDENKILDAESLLKDPNTKMIFASDLNEMPDMIKGIKYEPNPDIHLPEKMKENFPRTFNKTDQKKINRYYRLLRRYRVYNFKTKSWDMA